MRALLFKYSNICANVWSPYIFVSSTQNSSLKQWARSASESARTLLIRLFELFIYLENYEREKKFEEKKNNRKSEHHKTSTSFMKTCSSTVKPKQPLQKNQPIDIYKVNLR